MREKVALDKEETVDDSAKNEYQLQADRIRKILDEAIHKLQIVKCIPMLIEDDGKILRQFLNKTECDFITMVCKNSLFDRDQLDNRSDLILINNTLERTMQSNATKHGKNMMSIESYEIHVAYAVDILLNCKPLLEHIHKHQIKKIDPLVNTFIASMKKLRKVVHGRLKTTAAEEIKRENDLKTAYRSSMMLSENIQELEEQLEKQRQDLGIENDRKQAILTDLSHKIAALKVKTKEDIEKIIYDSELLMMKDYNKSVERQTELKEIAIETTQQYEQLLEDHLHTEKALRTKKSKVETQLASWVAKYDTDMSDKLKEYEELEKTFKAAKEEYDLLEEKFVEQEREYVLLMHEKEAEDKKINEEIAWRFLQNRSAKIIQRAWRAYKIRKLAKKKGKKGKKKEVGTQKSSQDITKTSQTAIKQEPDSNAMVEKDSEQKDAEPTE